MVLRFLDKYKDWGLLFLRVTIGIMIALHGWPKIVGGPEKWAGLGKNMAHFGMDFAPEFWGFMAAFAEFGGGILLILGLFFRPALFLLVCTMAVATMRHVIGEDGFGRISRPIELGFVFLSMIFTGPGKFALDDVLAGVFAGKKEAKKNAE